MDMNRLVNAFIKHSVYLLTLKVYVTLSSI